MSYEETKFRDGFFQRQWKNEAGKLHREDGPAYIHYSPDGSIQIEHFCLNGVQHRELGPAYIRYYPDGHIYEELFYLHQEYLGRNDEGFWKLWSRLTDEQRQKPELLKYLARFS